MDEVVFKWISALVGLSEFRLQHTLSRCEKSPKAPCHGRYLSRIASNLSWMPSVNRIWGSTMPRSPKGVANPSTTAVRAAYLGKLTSDSKAEACGHGGNEDAAFGLTPQYLCLQKCLHLLHFTHKRQRLGLVLVALKEFIYGRVFNEP